MANSTEQDLTERYFAGRADGLAPGLPAGLRGRGIALPGEDDAVGDVSRLVLAEPTGAGP